MDITPIYELRMRLRAAMIAGTNLLSEDFRLKKVVENFASLSVASPVFEKINELSAKLLSDGSPETLLEMITLVDAVITTLSTTDITEELENILIEGNNAVIVNAPYSQLSPITDALTKGGNNCFTVINNACDETPELFKDYRVIPALVTGLSSGAADAAAKILTKQGKPIIPLVKKGFDPKGKKDMVRRVHILEDICGAEENDFYLEQLNESEKDVRKALIYALRHDAQNIDKLIELAKTEKGKLKTTALAALIQFNDEQAMETLTAFFNEYSKKKPAEILELLKNASSKWTSDFAARLIKSVLFDKDGNAVTLDEVMDGKIVLKSKASCFDIMGALWGKWGADIENIYREIDCKGKTPIVNTLTMYLGETIAATNDEGLKALAAELNNAPKTKDCYISAEATARLISSEDSSKWFAEQITAAYKKSRTDKEQYVSSAQITKALQHIFFENGKYYYNNAKYDFISETWGWRKPIPISQPLKGAISDALMKCTCWEYARILGNWIDQDDKEYCKKLGNYFLNLNSTILNTYEILGYLTKCGFTNIKGFLVRECKLHTSPMFNTLQSVIRQMPGDDEYRLSEVRDLVDNLRRRKIKMTNIDPDILLAWAESGMK